MTGKKNRWQIANVEQVGPYRCGVFGGQRYAAVTDKEPQHYQVVVSRVYTKAKWAALHPLQKLVFRIDSKYFRIGTWLTAVMRLDEEQMRKLALLLQEEIPTACEDRVFFADSKHVNADEALQAFCEF